MKKEYFLESEIKPTIDNFAENFRKWYENERVPLCLPNFHHFVCHFVAQIQFLGPPWTMTTQLDEKFHQIPIDIIANKLNGSSLSRDTLVKVAVSSLLRLT